MSHVYAIIPVFNRLDFTKRVIDCLKNQSYKNVTIIVINDGSTDSTKEYLANRKEIITVTTKGNCWWSKSINLGLESVSPKLQDDDYVLLLNNDTYFKSDFIELAIYFSRVHGDCAVGSVLYDYHQPSRLMDLAAHIDGSIFNICDLKDTLRINDVILLKDYYVADFLPGRGTLYPAQAIKKVGFMRDFCLPHYRADYEYSNRVKWAGYDLLVSTKLITFSTDDYGNKKRAKNNFIKYFGKSSPHNIIHYYAFYILICPSAHEKIIIALKITYSYFKRSILKPFFLTYYWIERQFITAKRRLKIIVGWAERQSITIKRRLKVVYYFIKEKLFYD